MAGTQLADMPGIQRAKGGVSEIGRGQTAPADYAPLKPTDDSGLLDEAAEQLRNCAH